ncbi:uncharacterized protein LOC119267639 isoform X2 [Triticum dicoccoides]|uniref:uncharacterized protein LOC119267639 isoform X2 n=1 Tax=Triticum dicoccoides TaxID=85692 RepID=UPI00188E4DC7|nr:uncharacterized protein LOC119267639 isoform X2 [Triticum dicoccoides]
MASNDGEGGEEGWEAAVRAEVGGASWWDDPDGADLHARFKAFTGQRRDWPEPKLLFWKDLLLRIARRLRLCSAPAHLVTSVWFARPGGITPLCLPQVLEEMRADGEILLKSELIVPTAGGLYQLVRRVSQMAISRRPIVQEDILVFRSLVEERFEDIATQLRGSHWTSTCVITMTKFNSFFYGREDAHAALCYLTQSGKTRYLAIRKEDPVEGVKFPLVSAHAPAVSKFDCDTLHLVWQEEKLQQQFDVLDRRWEISRRAALMSFKAGDKQGAFRYVRQSKLFSESRNKCAQLLERVEEVISLIASAESTKQVYEAIQIGMKAMKEHNVSMEDINTHLKEVDDLVAAQRKINTALESAPLDSLADEEDIEEEFRNLEAELEDKVSPVHVEEPEPVLHANDDSPDETVESLSNNLSSMKLGAM